MIKLAGNQLSLIDNLDVGDATGDRVGEWEWENSSVGLLPNLKSREQNSKTQHLEPQKSLLPNLDLLPTFREHDIMLPKSREQDIPKKPLANRQIREQLERGETVIGYSIVKIKSKKYLLTHSNSNKYYPSLGGWYDIKVKQKIEYLYIRWRDGIKQKSRCLGKLDLLE